MKKPIISTTDAALAMLGPDASTVTETAEALGISPAALLAAAWRGLTWQTEGAAPWQEAAQGWCNEDTATRQDVILAAVRLDAAHRRGSLRAA
jgi:hypothetical protein